MSFLNVLLTQVQRKVVADLLPNLADRLKLDEKNSRTISFTTNELDSFESASGKPVIMQCDPTFAGHATIRIARDDQPAHLLLHKQEHNAVLPYLVAFQCLLALRTIEANKELRFDLASKPNMTADVLKLTTEHAKNAILFGRIQLKLVSWIHKYKSV